MGARIHIEDAEQHALWLHGSTFELLLAPGVTRSSACLAEASSRKRANTAWR